MLALSKINSVNLIHDVYHLHIFYSISMFFTQIFIFNFFLFLAIKISIYLNHHSIRYWNKTQEFKSTEHYNVITIKIAFQSNNSYVLISLDYYQRSMANENKNEMELKLYRWKFDSFFFFCFAECCGIYLLELFFIVEG